MRNLQGRIEKLENQLNGDGLEGDLYDWHGEHITDARIVKWPTREHCGLAIMADGSKREIHANITLLDIILCRARQATGEEERAARDTRDRDMLRLRVDGKPGILERIYQTTTGKSQKGVRSDGEVCNENL